MKNYFSQLNQTALEGFKRLNKTDRIEHKRWKVPAGSWEVNVVRGKVLEKAATSRIILNTKNPLSMKIPALMYFRSKFIQLRLKYP